MSVDLSDGPYSALLQWEGVQLDLTITASSAYLEDESACEEMAVDGSCQKFTLWITASEDPSETPGDDMAPGGELLLSPIFEFEPHLEFPDDQPAIVSYYLSLTEDQQHELAQADCGFVGVYQLDDDGMRTEYPLIVTDETSCPPSDGLIEVYQPHFSRWQVEGSDDWIILKPQYDSKTQCGFSESEAAGQAEYKHCALTVDASTDEADGMPASIDIEYTMGGKPVLPPQGTAGCADSNNSSCGLGCLRPPTNGNTDYITNHQCNFSHDGESDSDDDDYRLDLKLDAASMESFSSEIVIFAPAPANTTLEYPKGQRCYEATVAWLAKGADGSVKCKCPLVNGACPSKCLYYDFDNNGSVDPFECLHLNVVPVCKTRYLDSDGDKYGDEEKSTTACDAGSNYVDSPGDCNESDKTINPGALETCDYKDNDCDGLTDDQEFESDSPAAAPPTGTQTCYQNKDGDTFGTSVANIDRCECPSGYSENSGDCDDFDKKTYPGASEICDLKDNDCDDAVDEDVLVVKWYQDVDGDGFGNPNDMIEACYGPPGRVQDNRDCDDTNAAINPNATEICDGVDNDCDWQKDEGYALSVSCDGGDGDLCKEGVTVCSTDGTTTICNDTSSTNSEVCDGADNDCDGQMDEGYALGGTCDGNDGDLCKEGVTVCSADGTTTMCNDTSSTNSEVCDGADNDCDGQKDEGYALGGTCDGNDGDLCKEGVMVCSTNGSTTMCSDISSTNSEVCDGVDNDCDGSIDEGSVCCTQTTWYRDSDGDGYGTTPTTQACTKPSGYAAQGGDCNDTNSSVNPGATEICDGVDNDCDSQKDEGFALSVSCDGGDGDLCKEGVTVCSADGTATMCNDTSSTNSEVCDGVDNDCDAQTDEGVKTTWYLDVDGDGYGLTNSTTQACSKPAGYASQGGDCDDTKAVIKPGATETCDSVDNDCDGSTDEGYALSVSCDGGDGDLCKEGFTVCSTDGSSTTCNDTSTTNSEVCDGQDNDCDGQVDEGVQSTWYLDIDGDGYGLTSSTTQACSKPSGYAIQGGDCYDANPAAKPGQTSYFSSDRGDGSFDYNCDNVATPWNVTIGKCGCDDGYNNDTGDSCQPLPVPSRNEAAGTSTGVSFGQLMPEVFELEKATLCEFYESSVGWAVSVPKCGENREFYGDIQCSKAPGCTNLSYPETQRCH